MRLSMLALVLGFCIDLILGDPKRLYHPIRIIGNLITALEKKLRSRLALPAGECNTPALQRREYRAGIILTVAVVLLSSGVPLLILLAAQRIHPYLRLAAETVFCWQLLAARSLRDESRKVYQKLREHDLAGGRQAVSMIVGRDTGRLDEAGVIRAAVETVAENTSDGVIAPMLYMAVGGAALGFFYKAVNTLDSMVGYKNERYLYFGRFAAKLDDAANFLPARLSALVMTAAAYLLGMNGKDAWRIWKRDRKNHASPNSAQTEAVMAGALGVQLAGDAWYFGKRYPKKTIGDALRPAEAEDIVRAGRLLYAAAFLTLLLLAAADRIAAGL